MTSDEVMDWENAYREDGDFDGTPPWNIGEPQPELAALIARGEVRSDVLDAGCGHAELSLALAAQGYTVVGMDVAPSAVAAAKQAAEDRGLTTATFVVDDITTFGGFDGRFNTIIDSTLFHSLPVDAREPYLRAAHRAAAPGARLYMLVFTVGAFPPEFEFKPNELTEDELHESVSLHWAVDEIRAAFIHAHPIVIPDAPFAMPSHDADDKGRLKFPALLLTAHKAG